MSKFWELFERSVILQAAITLVLVIGVTLMYLQGQEVPTEYQALLTLVLGFYFGGKVENAKTAKVMGKMEKEID